MSQSGDRSYAWVEGKWCIMIEGKWYQVALKIINQRPVISIINSKQPELTFPLKEIYVR